ERLPIAVAGQDRAGGESKTDGGHAGQKRTAHRDAPRTNGGRKVRFLWFRRDRLGCGVFARDAAANPGRREGEPSLLPSSAHPADSSELHHFPPQTRNYRYDRPAGAAWAIARFLGRCKLRSFA